MEGEAASAAAVATPLIVTVNFALAAVVLIVVGRLLARGTLTDGVPEGRQLAAESILSFFVNKAREMGGPRVVRTVAPFLATCFLLILISNMFAVLPIPLLNYPPTAFLSVTLGLGLCSVIGTIVVSGALRGLPKTVLHLFWPNPLELISKVTDVLSLSLRLFGNIAGEYLTIVLVTQAVAIGIPLILHVLGLIPAFVQALVFTLLTASFTAGALHSEEEHAPSAATHVERPPQAEEGPVAIEGEVEVVGPATPAAGLG